MKTKKNSAKTLKTKTKQRRTPARIEVQPRVRHQNEQETDFGQPPEDEGRMVNLTSVRHGSGYSRQIDFSRGPEDDLAA